MCLFKFQILKFILHVQETRNVYAIKEESFTETGHIPWTRQSKRATTTTCR